VSSMHRLQRRVHQTAKSKGFWDKDLELIEATLNFPDHTQLADHVRRLIVCTKLALIHSEGSEAVESVREDQPAFFIDENGKPQGIASELADVIIRCMDLAEFLEIDLGSVIEIKTAYNEYRKPMHGGKAL
jgi:NTP pyrophosphatase (non-canonical NTP hydrolase)